MGNLHAGHAELIKHSKRDNQITILSVFINPTQFNNPDDLKNYPKTLDDDLQIAKKLDVDAVFFPDEKSMYPDNYQFQITEKKESKLLCGAFRPGHFDGVLTIVLKLLMLTKPDYLYLGEKDYQQLHLIDEMVKAFFISTQIIPVKTIRNQHGLALSSRNGRLTDDQLKLAEQFAALLASDQTCEMIQEKLIALGFSVDYVTEIWGRRFGAVTIGGVRLIDNVALKTLS